MKEFVQVDNVFSQHILTMLTEHCHINSSDNSSYDIWPAETTNNNTAKECFSETLLGRRRMLVIQDLYENPILPCYQKPWLKTADIAIQKLPPGGYITRHMDTCFFSLTVFLNSVVSGGEFKWWDADNNTHIVSPRRNTGITAYYDFKLTQGAYHEVTPIDCDQTRYTLQLFVFDKSDPDKNTVKF